MAAKTKEESKKLSIIRPLGNVECYEFHMLQLRFFGGTIVNCRYTIPPCLATPELQHEDVVARFEDALARVVLEHPALRLDTVNVNTKRPAWIAIGQVDFAHHVQWEDVNGSEEDAAAAAAEHEEMLRERIETLLDEPYAGLAGRPKWRVLVLFKKGAAPFLDVVFDYSHAFGDGISGKIFHETLLRVLNTGAASGKQTSHPALANRVLTIPPTAAALPPPVEKRARFPVAAKFALSTAWRELMPPGLALPSSANANWAPIRPAPFRTRLGIFNVEPAALKGILAACRAHDTTVTALLHALLLVSMAARLPANKATAFTGITALDLRRYLDADAARTMADYVSQTPHQFGADVVREIRGAITEAAAAAAASGDDDPAPSPALAALVWRCAARVRGEIRKRLDDGLRDNLVGLMRLVPDWRAQFRVEASKARPYSFFVTNLGVLDGDGGGGGAATEPNGEAGGRWGVAHSVFATSPEVCGAAFQVSPISVRGGALCVSCSWQDCVVDVELAEAIVADLERWLRCIGTS
ncbi:alcohol acetyltransferase-domain-containing protein [Hypoxylon argillaceum]|nr:alcohol acetyltransferase-domain-containing protein [Hypoxylon argillaceum]